MASPKKPKAPTKKAAPKAAAKPSAPTSKPTKPATKAPVKAVATPVAKAVKTAQAKPEAKKPAHLHALPAPARSNPPTPKWMEDALTYAQANPAVMLVSIIAAFIGIMLIF